MAGNRQGAVRYFAVGWTWSALLLLILHVVPVMAQTCQPNGDINDDGMITPADALLAFRHFLAIAEPPLTDCHQARANVSRPVSSSITPDDALCIFQQFLRLPSCFPAQPPASPEIQFLVSTTLSRSGSSMPLASQL
jgi:hypothetical protein